MTVVFTCTQITTQIINGKITYIAVLQYQNSQGLGSIMVDSPNPMKLEIGKTYTLNLG